jgi:hypothetical protein
MCPNGATLARHGGTEGSQRPERSVVKLLKKLAFVYRVAVRVEWPDGDPDPDELVLEAAAILEEMCAKARFGVVRDGAGNVAVEIASGDDVTEVLPALCLEMQMIREAPGA